MGTEATMKSWERKSSGTSNHEAAIALHYMHYNFARIHQSLRVTPAMVYDASADLLGMPGRSSATERTNRALPVIGAPAHAAHASL